MGIVVFGCILVIERQIFFCAEAELIGLKTDQMQRGEPLGIV